MKEILVKILFVLLVIFIQGTAFCQTGETYFQQKVDYNIEVSLNTIEKELDGFITLDYQNNSPDTLHYIWFHLWPNAFKNDRTAFSEQLLQIGRTDFYFSQEDQKGFINKLNFKADGVTATLEDHPQYIDVAKLILPVPLLPGKQVIITTPFHVKIPYNFSRGGYVENTFQITQWYPKPAVYDRKGWHPIPYLDQGEFYSEFGNFEVKITVPEDYGIAATGEVVSIVSTSTPKADISHFEGGDQSTFVEKKTQPTNNLAGKIKSPESFDSKEKKPVKNKPIIGVKRKKVIINSLDKPTSGKSKTYYLRQDNVHDFAWFADKNFIIKEDTLQLPSGRIIKVSAYYLPGSKDVWKNSLTYIKEALLTRSRWLGEYPYSTAKAVETKMAFAGGMEYPTITNISPVEDERSLDLVIEHEIGHNWNYGILASNERDHPWMDEGINTFYDNRYEALKYPKRNSPAKENFLIRRLPADFMEIGLRTLVANKNDQVVETKSEEFSSINYSLIAYYKTGQWVSELENYLGEKDFNIAMKEYYNTWKFKHPYPEDFRDIIEKTSGKSLDSLFSLLSKKGSLKPPVKKEYKLQTFFSFKETNRYHYIFLSPSIGINYYDKLMIGGLVHNYTLPEPNFHFFAAPMYGTGSKTLTGMARAGYNIMSYGAIRKTEIALSGAKYSIDDFTDSSGRNHVMGFHKIAPSIKFIFKNKNARSNIIQYAQWKTYFIEETGLLFSRDTVAQKDIITFPKSNRYLNQLTFSLENNRELYPFSTRLVAEQGKGFARLAFDGNYYFNYARGGGMEVRLFAGKFFYLEDQTSHSQYQYKRYHLNMTGANGYEDYTYSNYFTGRNEFEKFSSQQISIRDGGFKVRTDLLNNKVGNSDNWLASLNFKTDFPRDFNPLQVLPFKIPLKIFLDVGTYSEAWKADAATEKFIFDAGLQLSLFKDILNIYVPLLYSNVYQQYFKSTIPKEKRFLQNISFSIDIQKFRFNQWAGIPDL